MCLCVAVCAPAGLTNADQRITEDVEKFAHTASELISHTFKP
jgi:ATP-binding cassette subfamily D (ALD) protein 3